MEKKIYTQKQLLYKERMELARMMAMFFNALCNHEKAVYRFSRYSVRGSPSHSTKQSLWHRSPIPQKSGAISGKMYMLYSKTTTRNY